MQKLTTWYNLTSDSFQEWYDTSKAADLLPEITITPPPKTFCSNIIISITDYPKLKEDKHCWHT
jgi:hypothetical protein